MPRAPKRRNSVANTFLNTVHLLPKDLRFEHGGAKLASCPCRHLTSVHPCTHRMPVFIWKCCDAALLDDGYFLEVVIILNDTGNFCASGWSAAQGLVYVAKLFASQISGFLFTTHLPALAIKNHGPVSLSTWPLWPTAHELLWVVDIITKHQWCGADAYFFAHDLKVVHL